MIGYATPATGYRIDRDIYPAYGLALWTVTVSRGGKVYEQRSGISLTMHRAMMRSFDVFDDLYGAYNG